MDIFWRNPIFYWKCDNLSPSLSSFAVQAAGKDRVVTSLAHLIHVEKYANLRLSSRY